jgi:hypothetical protein
MRYQTAQGKRTLADRSKYTPHQSVRERMRRVGQILKGHLQPESLVDGVWFPTVLTEAEQATYIDYATTKAAGGDLSKFRPVETVLTMTEGGEGQSFQLGVIDNDQGDVSNVTILPEEGPDTPQG